MIIGEFYRGQGLGNQLFTYASIRGIAKKLDRRFGFVGIDKFKGTALFDIDFGDPVGEYPKTKIYERRIVDPSCGHDVSVYDYRLERLAKNTSGPVKIEGLLAGNGYWPGGREFLRDIIKVTGENGLINKKYQGKTTLHVRGGDFLFSNSGLGFGYYYNAMNLLDIKRGDIVVVTDDPKYARSILGDSIFIVSTGEADRLPETARHHMGGSFIDDFGLLYRSGQLIISNSSFALWAALLSQGCKRVIAPKFWAANCCKNFHWSPGDMIFEGFEYV